MLIEFEGTIDPTGLRTFRSYSRGNRRNAHSESLPNRIQFWAVLESDSAMEVMRELRAGYTASAHRLLEELAVSLGTHTK